MTSVSVVPTSELGDTSGIYIGVDRLPDEMNEMKISDDKEVEATVVDENGTETGHSGRNGQPKKDYKLHG